MDIMQDNASRHGSRHGNNSPGHPSLPVLARRYAVATVLTIAVVTVLQLLPSGSAQNNYQLHLPPGITPVPHAGAPGTTIGGINCAPGIRQVPWTAYAPSCVPAWRGDNGGSTSPGVTSNTITVTYRKVNSSDLASIASIISSAMPSDSKFIADLRTYINLFNRTYELWGRKVVLKTFTATGNFLSEDQGLDQPQAQADALTAKQLGAFADLTFPMFSSQIYEQYLAEQHIVSLSSIYMPDSWFRQYYPYEYTIFPTGTQNNQATVDLVCERLAHLPATFAGSSQIRSRKRVFGLLIPENPVYAANGNYIASHLASLCGIHFAARDNYTLSVSQASQQASTAIAQMKSAGVTTIICGCDPLEPVLFTSTATNEGYYPEWMFDYWLDPLGRKISPPQAKHSMVIDAGQWPNSSSSEALKVFRIASHGAAPKEPYFALAYKMALELFARLQAAGPNLTPQTFAKGIYKIPPSATTKSRAATAKSGIGEFGPWRTGPYSFYPATSYQFGWWNPSAVSNLDGQSGAWENCNGGTWYPYTDPQALKPLHTQPACFGR